MVAFSGHGTSIHELVTHDANVEELPGSCVSLDELTELISEIPHGSWCACSTAASAGGAGAKVLNSPRRPRAADSLRSPRQAPRRKSSCDVGLPSAW